MICVLLNNAHMLVYSPSYIEKLGRKLSLGHISEEGEWSNAKIEHCYEYAGLT
jgi:hypothetical protein